MQVLNGSFIEPDLPPPGHTSVMAVKSVNLKKT